MAVAIRQTPEEWKHSYQFLYQPQRFLVKLNLEMALFLKQLEILLLDYLNNCQNFSDSLHLLIYIFVCCCPSHPLVLLIWIPLHPHKSQWVTETTFQTATQNEITFPGRHNILWILIYICGWSLILGMQIEFLCSSSAFPKDLCYDMNAPALCQLLCPLIWMGGLCADSVTVHIITLIRIYCIVLL